MGRFSNPNRPYLGGCGAPASLRNTAKQKRRFDTPILRVLSLVERVPTHMCLTITDTVTRNGLWDYGPYDMSAAH